MILLSDNDIIGKLAACDLLDQALEVLAATRQEVFVLGTARYVLGVGGTKRKRSRRFDEATLERISAFLDSVQLLPDDPSLEELARLNNVPGIDPGEAILYASTASFQDFLLATDDRRSLRALVAESMAQVGDMLAVE